MRATTNAFVSPAGGQLAAFSLAGLLSLTKLAADAYMAISLDVLKSMYSRQVANRCSDCTVPRWFTGAPYKATTQQRQDWVAGYRYSVLNFWLPFTYANIAYAALVIHYLVSFLVMRARSKNRDGEWIWVRSDLILFPLLGACGLVCGILPLILTWPFGDDYNYRAPPDQPLFSARTCSDLGKDCAPARLGIILAFLLAAIFVGLATFELVYIIKYHSGRMGWRHSLSFLQAVPEYARGKANAYSREKSGDQPFKYNSGELGDIIAPEDTPLVPFTGGTPAAYQGQGDAPPAYTFPSDSAALSGTSKASPSGPSSGPSATATDELPPFVRGGPSGKIDEELPAFSGPSGGGEAGYLAHKAALVEKGPR